MVGAAVGAVPRQRECLQLRIGARGLRGDGSDLAELLPLPELARFGTRDGQLLGAPVERLLQRA